MHGSFHTALVVFALLPLSAASDTSTGIIEKRDISCLPLEDACQQLVEKSPFEKIISDKEDISMLLQGRASVSMHTQENQSEDGQSLTPTLLPKQPQRVRPGSQQQSMTREQQVALWISGAKKHMGILLFYTVLVSAYAMRGCWTPNKDVPSSLAQPREKHWDVAKASFMWLVVCTHIPTPDLLGPTWLFPTVLRFEMPGFSFVSGIMAASGVRSIASQNSSLQHDQKLMNRVRDLILPNFTCPPLLYVLALAMEVLTGSKAISSTNTWQDFFKRPVLRLPGTFIYWQVYWYLLSLFLWNLLAPTLRLLRLPVLTTMLMGLICGEITVGFGTFNSTLGLSVFFVVGFSLGGGGLSPDERAASREQLENQVRSSAARIMACTALITWTVCMTYTRFQSGAVPEFARDPWFFQHSTWTKHGLAMDALSLLIAAVGVFCIIVVCFMIPGCVSDVVGSIGSRSLYVYLLHFPIVNVLSVASVPDPVLGALLVLTVGLWVMAILGSALTQKLTEPFVQPQWLINMLFVTPQPLKDVKPESNEL